MHDEPGGGFVGGLVAAGAVAPAKLIIVTPSDKPAAEAARERGARINPPASALSEARVLVLAVKPAKWREAMTPLAAGLRPDAVIVSVMAGVAGADIEAVTGRPVARVMPTTAVAQGRGVAALWSGDAGAGETARAITRSMASNTVT